MIPQQCIAHYREDSKLAKGAMGAVYQANDSKPNRGFVPVQLEMEKAFPR